MLRPSRYEGRGQAQRGAVQDILAAANEPTTLEEIIVNSAIAPGGEDSKSLPTIVNHVAAASSRCRLVSHITPCEAQTKKTTSRRDLN